MVRKKGLFRQIAIARTPKLAFLKGRHALRSSASASFKIDPLDGPEDFSQIASNILPTREFRKSKIDRNVFVQRRSFRISSPGEKREITFKGIQVLKARGRKKGKGVLNIFG